MQQNALLLCHFQGFLGGSDGKESACNAGDLVSIPGLGRSPGEKAWQPTPVFLPGESPWTEEPGGLQSTGLQSQTQLKRLSRHARTDAIKVSEGLPEVLTHCLPGNRPHSGQLHTFLPLEGSGGTHMDLWPIWSTEGGDGWPLSSPWFYYYYFKIFIHLLCLNETKTGLSCSTQGYSILVVAYGIFTCSKQDLVPWPGMEPAPYSQPTPRYTRARAHTHTHTHTHTQSCDNLKHTQELWRLKTSTGHQQMTPGRVEAESPSHPSPPHCL